MIVGTYGTGTLRRVSGLTVRQIDTWVWRGLITPLPTGRRNHRWSFQQLVAIRAMADLRRAGVEPAALERISAHLQTQGLSFGDTYLIASGSDVWMVGEAGVMSILRQPRQLTYLVYGLQESAQQVRQELAALAAAA